MITKCSTQTSISPLLTRPVTCLSLGAGAGAVVASTERLAATGIGFFYGHVGVAKVYLDNRRTFLHTDRPFLRPLGCAKWLVERLAFTIFTHSSLCHRRLRSFQ